MVSPPDPNLHYQPPPIATVEVPIRRISATASNSTPPPPHSTIVSSGYGGAGASHHDSAYNEQLQHETLIRQPQQLYHNSPITLHNTDQRTHYSNSTKSTGSGGNNNLLQVAFPTAEFALQQQLLQQQQLQQQFHQQNQMQMIQHQQKLQSPESSPWTLGSTDGDYAMALVLRETQHSDDVQQLNNTEMGPDAVLLSEITKKMLLHQEQTSIEAPATSGAAIANTGEAADSPENDNLDTEARRQRQQKVAQEIHDNAVAEKLSERNPILTATQTSAEDAIALLGNKRSLYQERIFRQPSASVEACLAAACEVMNFGIAEMWLRTGPKTHQLTNSHLRPTALDDSVRKDLVEVYYGEKSSERTHRLSPALCKRAKEAGDVVWVTAVNPTSAEALRVSISNVRTAVAVPVCHQASNTNITILFFSIRRIVVQPTSVEFLVHMSLAAGVASVNSLADEGLIDRELIVISQSSSGGAQLGKSISRSNRSVGGTSRPPAPTLELVSVTGAPLDLQWRQLSNVEYLTDGGNSWIHTAVFQGKPVVVKTLKPECQDVALAINEIEGELSIHSRLNHPNIVALLGAGLTSKGVRFFVLERLDGGTLTQMLGYETRIRDRRRRFWRKKLFSFLDVLRIARSIAEAMSYCHERAMSGCVILHRDLKPDNIGFTLDGTVKLLDFGLAKVVEHTTIECDEVYAMSGETGSLRYMAPEVAEGLPYNYTADVYSFGIVLWELNATKKPYEGLNRELFYERVVHGGERPPLGRKWPSELTSLISECWDADIYNRPKFRDIVHRIDAMLLKEKGGGKSGVSHTNGGIDHKDTNEHKESKPRKFLPKISGMIDRHSTWF